MSIDYNRIPDLILQAINGHVRTGSPTGHFVQAVLENNLEQAVARADTGSLGALREIVTYVNCRIPGMCWGSRDKVAEWRKEGGADGHLAKIGLAFETDKLIDREGIG